MFWAWARKFRFFLEANPVGCRKKYLLVPKGFLRKPFFIEKKLIVLKIRKLNQESLAVSSICFCGFEEAGFYLSRRTIWEKLSKKQRFFPSTCLDREEKNFGLMGIFSRKDVKISFYVSTRTFWGNFRLKFWKFFNFFGHWAKILLNKAGERHRGELSETFVTSKDILRRPFWRFPKLVDPKKRKVRQASRSFHRSLLSDSNRSFGLWDILSVHAIVLAKSALACTKMFKYEKVEEMVWFWKIKNNFNGTKKRSLSRVTILLHETPVKSRLNFIQRGRRKIQLKIFKLIVTGLPAAAGLFSNSNFVRESSQEVEIVYFRRRKPSTSKLLKSKFMSFFRTS